MITFRLFGPTAVITLLCNLSLQAQPPGYYNPATGLLGAELQEALHQIIDDHTVLSYSYLWTAFYTTDDKPNGMVWDIYSDIPGGVPPYEYTFGVDQAGSAGSEGEGYNREHSFPRSWFGGEVLPMNTDLNLIYPTDVYVNSMRGSYAYGVVGSAQWTSLNGSKRGACATPGYNGTVFEPIDDFKGDLARTYFYVATRYYGEDGSWPGGPMSDGAVLLPWVVELLLTWHQNDPVSQKELDRNAAVYNLQNNRNPFIDDMEFASRIYDPDYFVDETAPRFLEPLPVDQPEPAWIDSRTVLVGCTAWDSSGTVDAATLARRLDLNQDLDYGDAAEEWQELSGYTDAEYIVIQSSITFPADGLFHAEFRASDTAGNGPGYSLGIEGIGDDIVIRIDTTSPEATELALGGTTTGSVTLLFTPTEDLTFSRYEVYFAEDSLVDENDLLWGEANDPALAERDTYTTTVSGLAAAADYWFSMRVIDGLNHIGAWSQILPASTTGIAPAAVSDLAITTGDGGVHLSWTAPTVDENGNTPVTITGYEVHASNTAHFLPGIDTWIAGTTGTSFFHNNALESGTAVFYRVVVLGSGENSGELVLLPAGTFTMGQVGTNGIPEHQVTITSPCQLSDHEVTTVDYLLALQWAFDNGYVTASSSTVQAYGQELLDLDDVDCEIGFSDGIFTIQESLSSYAQNAYPAGYDPATHPVKEVSWYGAACYCDWRSLREGFPPYYNGDWSTGIGHNPYTADGYTLPTEAQWELAARYNDNRTYPWGETTPGCGYANMYDSGYCVGWTVPVASYPAGDSQLGLYDLAGNLWEWVNDWYAGYPAVPQSDPLGAASGAYRVMRGGGWTNNASSLRSASRNNSAPGTTDYGIGFRIALQD